VKIRDFVQFRLVRKLLQTEASEERTYFALTLVTGVSAGLIAVALNKSIYFFTDVFGTNTSFGLKALILGGIAALISGYVTTRKFPSTGGSGIPGVRVAIAVFNGKITFLSSIAKFFVSVLSLSAGFSLGQEGPTVASTAGVGSVLGSFFHMPKKRVKSLVAIGSAGGIAAAFGTPIAAVVFTLEEIVGDLNAKMLGSIVISSVVASVTAQSLQGDSGHFFTSFNYKLNDSRELLFYLVVGFICAIMGPLWVKSVLSYRQLSIKHLKGHKLTLIMLTFLMMAAISQFEPKVLGIGHGTIEEALLSLFMDWKILLWLFVFKFIATTICYGSGISGGLFMPTLLMGAMLGGCIGSISSILFPGFALNTGAFALIGMGAFFAAVIRSPFTSIIMVFELTRDYNIILPLMVSNIVAYAIASKIHHGSIFENISEQDGIHLPTRDDNDLMESLTVEEAMINEPITLSAQLPIKDAMAKVQKIEASGFPVLKNGLLIGMVSTADVGSAYAKRKKGQRTVEDISTKNVIKIYPDQSLLVAFHKLKQYQISRLAVVSRINDKRLVGIITAEDIVRKFGYHLVEETKAKSKTNRDELFTPDLDAAPELDSESNGEVQEEV